MDLILRVCIKDVFQESRHVVDEKEISTKTNGLEPCYICTYTYLLLKRSQIKLPSCLDCEVLTEDRLSYSEILIRKGGYADELRSREPQKSTLSCLLDGNADVTLTDGNNISTEEIQHKEQLTKLVRYFHRVSLNPGDCIHIPGNWLYKLSTGGRTALLSIVYDSTNLKINKNTCGGHRVDMTLDGLSFKNETLENFFDVISLANLAIFIENYVQKPNMTKANFMEKFKKNDKLKEVKIWDEECEATTMELFTKMDVDQNNILSVSDFDSVDEEYVMFLGGFLEDRMADFKDIVDDQLSEIKPERGDIQGMASRMKSGYEKEIQRVLEEGFNEILKESNIDGAVSFSEDGKPKVYLKAKEKEGDDQIEEILADQNDDLEKVNTKEEL